MNIVYGNYQFDGPHPIKSFRPLYRAGIYAIMLFDSRITPMPYNILYFGESGNLSERDFNTSHHKYNCWLRYAGSIENLYIGVHLMPNSTEQQRCTLESELINMYSPVCND